jgi:hypothetical protein
LLLWSDKGSKSTSKSDDFDLDTPGYTQCKIEFWVYTSGMDDSGDDFTVGYDDGSTFNTIATYVYQTDFDNDEFNSFEIIIYESSYTFPSDARIRFQSTASGSDDSFYFDEIKVSGSTGGSKFIDETVAVESVVPQDIELGNYPNPFNPSTTICYNLPVESHVELSIYDITGRKITELFNGYQTAGKHTYEWEAVDVNGRKLTSGVYLLYINAGKYQQTVKMMYTK